MLKIDTVSLTRNHHEILKDICLSLPRGKIVGLLGPSGSGKTSLLRVIAGLESFEKGNLTFVGKPIKAQEVGLVFQHFQLFPHLTILQNLTLAPIKKGGLSVEEATQKALAGLDHFQLASHKNKYPHQISGGQKQRVAIARTLMMNPRIILFDEPTSALDPEMVNTVSSLIANLKSPERLIIMATHEMRVAQKAADDIVFMDHGHVLCHQVTQSFFVQPENNRAKEFIKNMA